MRALSRAVRLLHRGYTCVACDRDRVLTSQKPGVAPLLEWLDSDESLRGCTVADRTVGREAAMLLLRSGVSTVYADVMSAPARSLLREAGVETEFAALVRELSETAMPQ